MKHVPTKNQSAEEENDAPKPTTKLPMTNENQRTTETIHKTKPNMKINNYS